MSKEENYDAIIGTCENSKKSKTLDAFLGIKSKNTSTETQRSGQFSEENGSKETKDDLEEPSDKIQSAKCVTKKRNGFELLLQSSNACESFRSSNSMKTSIKCPELQPNDSKMTRFKNSGINHGSDHKFSTYCSEVLSMPQATVRESGSNNTTYPDGFLQYEQNEAYNDKYTVNGTSAFLCASSNTSYASLSTPQQLESEGNQSFTSATTLPVEPPATDMGFPTILSSTELSKPKQHSFIITLKVGTTITRKLFNNDSVTSLKSRHDSKVDSPKSVHPFFLKRQKRASTKENQSNHNLLETIPKISTHNSSANVQTNNQMPLHKNLPSGKFGSDNVNLKHDKLLAPIAISHCRGNMPNIPTRILDYERKKSKRKDIPVSENENILDSLVKKTKISNTDIYTKLKTLTLNKPRRLVLEGDKIKQLANKIEQRHMSTLEYLVRSCPEPKAFDRINCDSQLWCVKYAPPGTESVITGEGNAANVKSWLDKKIARLDQCKLDLVKKKKKAKNPLDDFIVDMEDHNGNNDGFDDNNRLSKFLLLYGMPGTGKTSAVYAAAKELGAYVFEINSGQRRGGKDLLGILEGIGQSHLVHKGEGDGLKKSRSIVLIEDVDIIFEEDTLFWAGLEKFANTSKRPIVLTCTSPTILPSHIIDEEATASFLQFTSGPKDLIVDALYLIALNEGHLLNRDILDLFIEQHNWDIRSCIINLQFWCQMGIGGRKSGVDWFPMGYEMSNGKRVISENTFIGFSSKKIDCSFNNQETSLLDDYFMTLTDELDTKSIYDNLKQQTKSLFHESVYSCGDQVLGLPATSEVTRDTSPLDHEMKVYDEIFNMESNKITPECIKNRGHQTFDMGCLENNYMEPSTVRDILSFLSFRSSFSITIPSYNSIECIGDKAMITEIAPYIRNIARLDLESVRAEESIRQNLGIGARVTRRSFRALGAKEKYLDGDPEEILSTGSYSWVE